VLRSHIVLSACGVSECARERGGHGVFSTALLKLLDTTSPEKLRYCDILANIEPIPKSVSSVTVSFIDALRLMLMGFYMLAARILNAKVMLKLGSFLMERPSSFQRFIL
jgi:hypothetical protein